MSRNRINSSISCIIPFWNEDKRLFTVLSEVVKVKGLSKIICIDDASDKDQSQEIRNTFPDIKLIRLKNNIGKSGAILEGLKYTRNSHVLLLDADLRNLNHVEINNAVSIIHEDGNVDMLIFRRIKAPFLVRLTRGDVLLTGERIVRKEYLNKILKESSDGWQLESKINQYMNKNKKRVFWVSHSGINTYWKWGFSTDLKYHKKKMADIYSIGLINLIILFLFLGRRNICK